MFNFQKEVVLNSLDKAEVIESTITGMDKKVRFHDGGEYFAKYIVEGKIYRTLPIEGDNFVLTITPNAEMLGKHIQILIELGLDSDYRGDYGSAIWYFRKPILVDVVLPDTEAGAAKVITDAINTIIPKEYQFITVDKWTEGKGDVVIKGVDSYQKVRKVVISEYVCEDRCAGSSEELSALVNLSRGDLEKSSGVVVYTRNNPEFGTYNYVLHNLRLPTYANLRFTSPSAPEMPVQGVAYAQYSFAYCVPRGINFGGLSVAGQTNHSTTLHTFYVPVKKNELGNYEGNSDFEKLFTDLGMSDPFVELGRKGDHTVTILPDQYASSQDLKASTAADTNAKAIKANADAIKTNSDADALVAAQVNKNKAAIKANHPEADV